MKKYRNQKKRSCHICKPYKHGLQPKFKTKEWDKRQLMLRAVAEIE